MRNEWASPATATSAEDFLNAIRKGMLVRTIVTPRKELKMLPSSCQPSDINDPIFEPFDFIPATDGQEIVGVFQKVNGKRIFERLRESFLVEADSSLIDFIESADKRPFALLVEERQIIGLVTHADLQRLPVYTVMFGLINAVEMQLLAWIRENPKSNGDAWLKFVQNPGKIEENYQKRVTDNNGIDRLSCATFSQERDAARGLGLFKPGDKIETQFKDAIELRNQVCHCIEIAPEPPHVAKLAATVGTARELTKFLTDAREALRHQSEDGK